MAPNWGPQVGIAWRIDLLPFGWCGAHDQQYLDMEREWFRLLALLLFCSFNPSLGVGGERVSPLGPFAACGGSSGAIKLIFAAKCSEMVEYRLEIRLVFSRNFWSYSG